MRRHLKKQMRGFQPCGDDKGHQSSMHASEHIQDGRYEHRV